MHLSDAWIVNTTKIFQPKFGCFCSLVSVCCLIEAKRFLSQEKKNVVSDLAGHGTSNECYLAERLSEHKTSL